MSVEALLAEVTPIVALRSVIEAAESIYFHDRRALSDVKPETSHGGHHDNQHGGRKGGDKVADAISDAKDALNKAKKGGGRNRHGSGKSESEDVSALRKELEELKLGYKSLVSELADLRKLVQNYYPLEQFLRIGNRVLVLGDGNLSFSLSLARLLPDVSVTATVLEPEDMFYHAYPKGVSHVEKLRELPNVEIVFGVDARQLPPHWKKKFTDVLMNHPHQGGKTNVKKSKILMKEIFASVRQFLDNSSTRFHLTLMSKQAGLDIDEIRGGRTFLDHQPNHDKDSWQIAYLAAEAELMIEGIDIFLPGLFSEYISAGFRNRDHPFFQRSEPIKMIFVPSPAFDSYHDLPIREFPDRFHSFRPFHVHDISILYTNSISDESVFLKLLSDLSRGFLATFWEIKELACVCPKSNFPNRIYRLIWQPHVMTLGKQKGNAFQEEFRSELVRLFADKRMPFVLT